MTLEAGKASLDGEVKNKPQDKSKILEVTAEAEDSPHKADIK